MSANILSLQEKGKLTALKNKWWKEKRGGGACQVSRVSRLTRTFLNLYITLLISKFLSLKWSGQGVCRYHSDKDSDRPLAVLENTEYIRKAMSIKKKNV